MAKSIEKTDAKKAFAPASSSASTATAAAKHESKPESKSHPVEVAVPRDPARDSALNRAVQQIERRDHFHATKFLSTRSPAVDDFSG